MSASSRAAAAKLPSLVGVIIPRIAAMSSFNWLHSLNTAVFFKTDHIGLTSSLSYRRSPFAAVLPTSPNAYDLPCCVRVRRSLADKGGNRSFVDRSNSYVVFQHNRLLVATHCDQHAGERFAMTLCVCTSRKQEDFTDSEGRNHLSVAPVLLIKID